MTKRIVHSNNSNNINYSVIIPHKNTPELLQRLLNTIPVRKDCEIIIVDDNSSESIVNFTNFPGKERPDITLVFLKEGRGAGYCRNEGLKRAIGEWVYFADADDIFTSAINNLFDKYANDLSLDMVFVNAKAFDENGKKFDLSINKYINNYLKGKKDALQVLRFQYWTPWSRLIKRKILVENAVKFEEVKVGNDVMGILHASKHAKKFGVEEEVVYQYYRPTAGSQTTNAYNNTYYSRMDLRFRINQFYIQNQYPYLWPIMYEFSRNKDFFSHDAKRIKRKYGFNWLKDLIIFVKYVCNKTINRI